MRTHSLRDILHGVFIHRSIKTRIETLDMRAILLALVHVFIHRSIKTRIETMASPNYHYESDMFLYIDPLKQGLKPYEGISYQELSPMFLYIVPLKQGLKRVLERNKNKQDICFYT